MWRKSRLLTTRAYLLSCTAVFLSLAPNAEGAKLYGSGGGGVMIIDTLTNTVDTTVLLPLFVESLPSSSGTNFQRIVESSLALDQRTAYFTTASPTLAQRGIVTFDTATNTFGTWYPMPYRRVHKVGVTRDLDTMFVVDQGCADDDPCADPRGSGYVHVVALATGTVITSIPIPQQSFDGVLSPDGAKFHVPHRDAGYVSVIDTASRSVVKTIPAARGAHDIVISPDGSRGDGQDVYVANSDLGPNSNPGAGSISAIISPADTLGATFPVPRPTPSGLTFSPNGRVLYVLGSGSRLVVVLDTQTHQVARIEAEADPVAVAFSPTNGGRAYIANQGGNSVSVFDTTNFPPSKLVTVAVR